MPPYTPSSYHLAKAAHRQRNKGSAEGIKDSLDDSSVELESLS